MISGLFGLIFACVVVLPRPARAGILSSFLKLLSGAPPGEIESGFPFIHETNAQVGSSALDAASFPGVASDTPVSEDPLNVVQDHALIAPLNPIGTVSPSSDGGPSGRIFIYTVRSGDTLALIAKAFDVTANTIRWANDLGSKSLAVGQELIILPVSGVRHEVKKGDTLLSIAKKYRAAADEIAAFNGLAVDEELIPGTTIIVPNGESPSSQPVTSGSSRGSSFSNLPSYSGYYIRPIVGGRKTRGIHGFNGIDLANSCGLPVVASADGNVLIAKTSGWNGGYGEYIVIAHANGTQTLYGHMSKLEVSTGQTVAQGQEIGLIGSTGNSTGCHVHFEVRGAKNPF